MMNYFYTYKNIENNKEKQSYILNVKRKRNPKEAVYRILLKQKRESYFNKLFKDYEYDINDIEKVRNYLPIQYQKYADNLELLKYKLITYRLIIIKYKIIKIEIAPKCLGCIYDSPGQRSHMIYPHGCLL